MHGQLITGRDHIRKRTSRGTIHVSSTISRTTPTTIQSATSFCRGRTSRVRGNRCRHPKGREPNRITRLKGIRNLSCQGRSKQQRNGIRCWGNRILIWAIVGRFFLARGVTRSRRRCGERSIFGSFRWRRFLSPLIIEVEYHVPHWRTKQRFFYRPSTISKAMRDRTFFCRFATNSNMSSEFTITLTSLSNHRNVTQGISMRTTLKRRTLTLSENHMFLTHAIVRSKQQHSRKRLSISKGKVTLVNPSLHLLIVRKVTLLIIYTRGFFRSFFVSEVLPTSTNRRFFRVNPTIPIRDRTNRPKLVTRSRTRMTTSAHWVRSSRLFFCGGLHA